MSLIIIERSMLSEKYKQIIAVTLIIIFLFYSLYLYLSLPVKEGPVTNMELKGKSIWQQSNCIACHQVYGLGGYLGPDLTNTYTLRGPAYITAFLQSGTAIMPKFHLKKIEIEALLAYLQNLDASGKADPRTFTINTNGTIEQ